MRIMGIDPGLASVGYGVIEHEASQSHALASGCIHTQAGHNLALRLACIHDGLAEVIATWSPEVVCVESLFFCNNMKTAISVAQGRGVCILASAKANIPLVEYTPLQIKQAVVGYGKASKQQVEKMVRVILGMSGEPSTSHAADALAVALCHAHSNRFSQMVNAAVARPRKVVR